MKKELNPTGTDASAEQARANSLRVLTPFGMGKSSDGFAVLMRQTQGLFSLVSLPGLSKQISQA